MSRNLMARIAVAAIFIPLILWICYRGELWLLGMVSLFALIGFGEYLIGEGHRTASLKFWLPFAYMVGFYVWLMLLFVHNSDSFLVLMPKGQIAFIGFFLISGMLYGIGKQAPGVLFAEHARMMWGIIYISLLYPFVFLLGEFSGWKSGGDLLLFLFAVLWAGDTAAMGLGSWLGKHKLAPAVSPNKSVEGFFGGLLGALVIGIVMYLWKFHDVPVYHVLILALGCSLFGQLGDLVESMWKRSRGIKDSSAIIPGHGGVLDRFDSLLFGAPFMYLYISFVIL